MYITQQEYTKTKKEMKNFIIINNERRGEKSMLDYIKLFILLHWNSIVKIKVPAALFYIQYFKGNRT